MILNAQFFLNLNKLPSVTIVSHCNAKELQSICVYVYIHMSEIPPAAALKHTLRQQ